MDDRKTKLYLALLCIVLMIWGSVLDGKRLHLKEVLEAENAELVHLVNETRASYAKAASTQEELQNKLNKLKEQLSELKKRNQELVQINKELKAELEKEKSARLEAESRTISASQPASSKSDGVSFAESFKIKELEARVQQLIREREGLQAQIIAEKQNSFSSSLKVTELESQLRYCRERMEQLEEEAQEARELRMRTRALERELAERTQDLWNTRLSLSADLDTCTRQLMRASAPPEPPASQPHGPCKPEMSKGPGKAGCGGKCKSAKGQGCAGCAELKKLKMQLDACSTRLDSLQKQFKESGMRYLEEIAQLKKAITGTASTPKYQRGTSADTQVKPPTDVKIAAHNDTNEEIERLKAEIQEKEKELEHYKKNTEALLEQIRQQRAQIKKLKAGK